MSVNQKENSYERQHKLKECTGASKKHPAVPAARPFMNRYLIPILVEKGNEKDMNPKTTPTFVQNLIFRPASLSKSRSS
jgi:hypothetical protein